MNVHQTLHTRLYYDRLGFIKLAIGVSFAVFMVLGAAYRSQLVIVFL